VLVGPEGGFHPEEIDSALRSGMRPVDLGPRILRTETAAVSAVAILQFLWGDLSQNK
jgi:16S rRNA (uracil1498-N3)-methyltransferase